MTSILSLHAGSGGVPKPAVAFLRATLREGKARIYGYAVGDEDSLFLRIRGAERVDPAEIAELKFEGLSLDDWGSAGRPTRTRFLIRFPNNVDDTKYHTADGNQAICLFAFERIVALQSRLPLFPGSLGENIVTQGVPFETLKMGQRIGMGMYGVQGMMLEITGPRKPCKTIEPYAGMARIVRHDETAPNVGQALGFTQKEIDPKWGGSGFYASIVEVWGNGIILPGDSVFFPASALQRYPKP